MKFMASILLMCVSSAFGQNCESVIALSKTSAAQVSDQQTIEQQARNFCSDYRQARSSGSSMDAGGSYGLFSASVGMTNQSSDSVASKYCSSENNYAASSSAYKSYVESISPNAYSAYQRCIELSNNDLRFSVDSAAILPDEFSISASFTSNSAARTLARLEIAPSQGVTCKSSGQTATVLDIPTGSSIAINCRRSNRQSSAYVRFVDRTSSAQPMTLPWQAYNDQGVPIQTLLSMHQRISAIESEVKTLYSEHGSVSLRAVNTRPLTDTSICPNSDAFRGEANGKVKFKKPFAQPPVVSIGMTSIDSGIPANTGMRLTVAVTSVQKDGFSYSFGTWCNTSIASAQANWIAVSR
jgi:hypothetical protein